MTAMLNGSGTAMSDTPPVNPDPNIQPEDISSQTPSTSSAKPATPILKSVRKEKSPSTTPARAPAQGPQLIGHLPRAEEEAFRTFVNLEDNVYQYQTLGRPKTIEESYLCDCSYQHGVSDPDEACGEGSDCINRLTQVECEEGECRCLSHCLNQRFQQKSIANVHVVLTEKKGYGLRAGEDISKDGFIYEYIGEVVSHPSFMKRMREYAEEGLRHFYFMMLQKDEYIDATKKGGIGRFVNHSCNPNAYVAKWTVGKRLRMGIFAKRKIKKDEELTFNYNVDRYGHEAQPCYCGESKCVGYIGGKTQTDLSTMDDLYLDALGITDEVEALHLKGSKKKKAKKLDEDFVPIMKPILAKEVPKVVQAIKQTTSKKVMLKLLTRIKITEDPSVLRGIMRLRAFSVMRALFQEYNNDLELICMGMECMLSWPLQNRNKVDDSKIEDEVSVLVEHDNEGVKSLAQKLVDHWATFSSAYRIPKRLADLESPTEYKPTFESPESPVEPQPVRKRTLLSEFEFNGPRPVGKSAVPAELLPALEPWRPTPYVPKLQPPGPNDIAALIASVAQAAEAKSQAEKEREQLEAEKERHKKRRREEKEKGGNSLQGEKGEDREAREAEKNANKEKRLAKLVGAVVVKVMSKYSKQLSKDLFKTYAKDITTSICEKEKKSSSYATGRLESLSEEKQAKIKKFTKTYMQKLLKKMEANPSSSRHQSNKPTSHAKMTPASDKTPPDADAEADEQLRVTQLDADDMMDIDMVMDDADREEESMMVTRLHEYVDSGDDQSPRSPPNASTSTSTSVTLVSSREPTYKSKPLSPPR